VRSLTPHTTHSPTASSALVLTSKPAVTLPETVPNLSVPNRTLGARLTAISGPYAGQSFPLSHRAVTLGRAADRDIPLPADTSVSRTHARITYEAGRHVVADDGASNGTLVNDHLLDVPLPLQGGDVIQIGATALRYE
jgi:pSer/pThr/pTyr-binding forkhead associated (FHA) protein